MACRDVLFRLRAGLAKSPDEQAAVADGVMKGVTMKLKRIYGCKNSMEAGMVASLLESEGFEVFDLNTSGHISFAGADLWYYVQISEDHYDEAKRVLIEHGFQDVI